MNLTHGVVASSGVLDCQHAARIFQAGQGKHVKLAPRADWICLVLGSKHTVVYLCIYHNKNIALMVYKQKIN